LATSLCGAANANATVSGPGTQATQGGDPCADLGGDDDNDGVCNDNDACPGFDDGEDPDMDGIPTGCDTNPMVADGFLIDSDCIDPNGPVLLTLDGDDGNRRNIYRNATLQLEAIWDVDSLRWEVRAIGNSDNVFVFNTLPSVPNPPSTMAQAWETESACSGQTATVTGTGTQDIKCDVSCDDSNSCTNDAVDDDCNCVYTSNDTELPVLTCLNDTVYLNDQGIGSYDENSLFTVTDNCGEVTAPLGQIVQVDCDTVGSTLEYAVIGAVDASGNAATPCTATVMVLDTFTMSACPPNSVSTLVNGRDRLLPNFPNPVIASTTIPFELAAPGSVLLQIYDLAGRPLWRRQMNGLAGENQVIIHREELGVSGVLTYTLTTETTVATGKMIVR
ncbi:MAG: T9SS type A sorting domain-containing protein, partial [Bacteroidota bacterium]